jgi:hypothetical protein
MVSITVHRVTSIDDNSLHPANDPVDMVRRRGDGGVLVEVILAVFPPVYGVAELWRRCRCLYKLTWSGTLQVFRISHLEEQATASFSLRKTFENFHYFGMKNIR